MPQRLRHPQTRFPDDFQNKHDQQHFCKQRQRRCLFCRFDPVQQLRRDQLRQIDRQTHEHPRQKYGQIKRNIFQDAQKRGKHRGGCIIIQTFKVFAEEGRKHHGGRAAIDQNHDFSLTELCCRHGRPLGIAHRREQPRLARQQPRYKVAGIQQKLRFCRRKRFAHTLHHGRVCFVFTVADGIFRPHSGVCLCRFLYQLFAADEPPQQAQVDPQQIGKALAGTAQIALARGFAHRAELEPLHRERNALCAAVQKQHRHACCQPFGQFVHILYRRILCRKSRVVQNQLVGLHPGAALSGLHRRGLTAGRIQQKRPERIQTGHAVKQKNDGFAMINRDLFGIIIRRRAKHPVQCR